jgi:hypothetical protein
MVVLNIIDLSLFYVLSIANAPSLTEIAAQKKAIKQSEDVKEAQDWFARCLATAAKGANSKYLLAAAAKGETMVPCHLKPYGNAVNELPYGVGCYALQRFFGDSSRFFPKDRFANGVAVEIGKSYNGCTLYFNWEKSFSSFVSLCRRTGGRG